MPWTIADVDKHKKGLVPIQKKKWVQVANKTFNDYMSKGETEDICSPKAIKTANEAASDFESALFINDSLVNVRRMEIFKVGKWNGHTFEEKDILEMEQNFKNLQADLIPKLKITHRDDQEALAGLASYGDIVNIYSERVGGKIKLFADINDVPLKVVEWIKDGRFKERSIELMWRYTVDDKEYSKVITAVSLLGHEIPAVSGMEPIKLKKEDNKLETKELVGVTFTLEDNEEDFQVEENGKTQTDEGGEYNMELKDILAKIASIEEQIASFVTAQKSKEDAYAKAEEADAKAKLETEISGYKKQAEELGKIKEDYTNMKDTFEKATKEKDELLKKNKEVEAKSFISELKAQGKIVPAFETEAFTLLTNLDNETKVGKFSVVDEKGKESEAELSQFEVFQNLLKKLQKSVDFKETSKSKSSSKETSDTEIKIQGDTYQYSDTELEEETQAYMKDNKCTYEVALTAISAKFNKEGKEQGLEVAGE